MTEFDFVAAGIVLLALWPKFIRRQLARLLKRVTMVRLWGMSIEFEREPDEEGGAGQAM